MLEKLIFGNLSWNAIPLDDPITLYGAGGFMITVGLIIFLTVTKMGKWGYLWKEWICSVDHKKIGIMYMLLAALMITRGIIQAVMMRVQQAVAAGGHAGFLPPQHYDQFFTEHGVIMIFFVAMPLVFGLINIALPLLIGARDVAYPYLNSLSFWLTFVSAMLLMINCV